MTHRTIALIAALLSMTAAGCKRSEAADALPPAEGPGAPVVPSPPKVDTADTASPSADQTLRATGTTLALRQADLGPKSSGILAAVLVEEGQKVRKGQPLFRLEATNPMLQVKQAEAGLAQARVGLTRAELDYNRMKPLVDQGAIAQATWDNVRIGYDQARVGVQQAEAAVATARAYAADTTVVAPFAGIVTKKLKNAGETVTMMPPTTVLVLQDLSKIEVRVKLAEGELTRIKVGEPMQVRIPTLNTERAVAIDRVNPAIDPMSRTIEVIGTITNDDRLLKAGSLVEVTFPTASAANKSPPAPNAANATAAQMTTSKSNSKP